MFSKIKELKTFFSDYIFNIHSPHQAMNYSVSE